MYRAAVNLFTVRRRQLHYCLSRRARADAMDCDTAAVKLRTDLSKNPDMREMLGFATLAVNGHNK
jgi:hypothetical protein